jgi:protein-S-isoprenylcysteine O-methyltransferase Ste14
MYWVAGLVAEYFIHRSFSTPVVIPKPYGYGGAVLFVVGIAMLLWVARRFRQAETTIRPFENSSELVTDGLFRFSRNPGYVGMVVSLAGAAVYFGSAFVWIPVLAVAVAVDIRFIRAEERMLRKTFGDPYDEYCRKVRRWV